MQSHYSISKSLLNCSDIFLLHHLHILYFTLSIHCYLLSVSRELSLRCLQTGPPLELRHPGLASSFSSRLRLSVRFHRCSWKDCWILRVTGPRLQHGGKQVRSLLGIISSSGLISDRSSSNHIVEANAAYNILDDCQDINMPPNHGECSRLWQGHDLQLFSKFSLPRADLSLSWLGEHSDTIRKSSQ